MNVRVRCAKARKAVLDQTTKTKAKTNFVLQVNMHLEEHARKSHAYASIFGVHSFHTIIKRLFETDNFCSHCLHTNRKNLSRFSNLVFTPCVPSTKLLPFHSSVPTLTTSAFHHAYLSLSNKSSIKILLQHASALLRLSLNT